MTKTDEIALLDKTIKAFGPNSYLGPWLAEHRMALVDDITNDVGPDATMPAAAIRQARQTLQDAHTVAEAIRSDAQRFADDARKKAFADVADIRQRAKLAIERLARELN